MIWDATPSVRSEIGTLEEVLVHEPGEEFSSVVDPDEWNWSGLPRQKRAAKEHQSFVDVLEAHDVTIDRIGSVPHSLAESLFVRDVGFAIEGGVVVGRMVESTRKGEERTLMEHVVERGIPIYHSVHGSGGFEVGNMVWIDEETVAIGRSQTTNTDGIRQIRGVLDTFDVDIVDVPIFGSTASTGQTHLTLVFSMVAEDLALLYPQAVPSEFRDLLHDLAIETIQVPMREQRNRATSTVVIEPGVVVMPAGNPETQTALENRGVDVTTLDIREIRKTGGGLKGLILPLSRSR